LGYAIFDGTPIRLFAILDFDMPATRFLIPDKQLLACGIGNRHDGRVLYYPFD
jgi:hypothetical protein